jgi:protease I
MRKFLVLTLLFLVALSGCIKKGPTPTPTPPITYEEGGEGKMPTQGKKILMIIAPTNFRDEELAEPKAVFEQAGATVTVASKGTTLATGMLGATAKVDQDITEVDVAEFDAVVFVGGSGASVYFNDPAAHLLAQNAYNQDKIVAAICIAPSTLANAGLLSNKRATCFSSEAENLKTKGASYTGEMVTVDGRIVTGNGPGAAKEFGQKIIEVLNQP